MKLIKNNYIECISDYDNEKNVRLGITVDNFSASNSASAKQQAYSAE